MRASVNSSENQEALKRYLRDSFRASVLPLPILEKSSYQTMPLKELYLQDITIRPKQAYLLAQSMAYYGQGCFKSIRLMNNGLDDQALSLIIDSLASYGKLENLEIGYNEL